MAEGAASSKLIRVAFALVLAYGAYELYGTLRKPDKTPTKGREQPKVANASSKPVPSRVGPRKSKERAPVDTWGRDPFVPVMGSSRAGAGQTSELGTGQQASRAQELGLKAISRVGRAAYALINRRVCSVGDTVEGHRVAEIGDDQVVLVQGERRIVLMLSGR